MARYQVSDATQVNVRGVVYGEGDIVEAGEAEAADWLARGLVAKVKPPVKRGAS